MITSIILISVVMLSLMTISGEVLHHFNREFVREDLQHYANAVLDQIADDIINANNISIVSSALNKKLIISTPNSIPATKEYSVHPLRGVLINSNEIPGLRFNSDRTETKYQFELIPQQFDCRPAYQTFSQNLKRSLLKVTLGFNIHFNGKNNQSIEYFFFEKDVYARNTFALISQ